ncbi:MAG: hypothetical protein CO186_12850 [Zetaproteobacteria bacterium CG_4_9_14_3_um_filter_49_83]|nr:MAG: hypothetical protein AUJ56_07815 [Zetaproteobacteria bacterium CG1_02_49_23]PIQ32803.1 MAG: hypothetical protein COW62_06790 [Zetaproteobacteria bacterium CG17_big_fil_post_rev_8_21_14_2_50_50_13]PIY56680.1 MAG: hypothetical protein COZ00_03020 [Zetaproteobacteria bacterium CG_4_10_14_0_8_um_filter_49_80]PJA33768.1 MAG: hypothetical protein CO186_12850 [Zetaproteobacteria bacterium CG_4_9_14_3_um_filter_49_83]
MYQMPTSSEALNNCEVTVLSKKFKRLSWLDQFRDDAASSDIPESVVRANSSALDDKLYELWGLGRDMLLAWTPYETSMDLVVVPHHCLSGINSGKPNASTLSEHDVAVILTGTKLVSASRLHEIAALFDTCPVRIELPFTPGKGLDFPTMDALVKRYGIALVEERAVALFDAVGFSLLSPFEQMTQLNSLAYSLNAATSKLMQKDMHIHFARTTTGDGFYIWNRKEDTLANLTLYHFMHLALADNSIARSKAKALTVPYLRACFHIGAHYEFHQAEGLSPTAFSYIVGDVTIVLARMSDQAMPGQVLIGNFNVAAGSNTDSQTQYLDSINFIKQAQSTIEHLEGIELAGDEVESILCYLTGPRYTDGTFGISRFRVRDKHGMEHLVFNAKINIYRRNEPPIFLGLQDSCLDAFRAKAKEEVIRFSPGEI